MVVFGEMPALDQRHLECDGMTISGQIGKISRIMKGAKTIE
jgi:hypothetical protein